MTNSSKKPFVVIDGSSYLYRAFHALPPLSSSLGEPTGAVFGVIKMIRKLLADYDCDYVAVVFDPKGKTFRDDLYAEYKAHRAAMPDDLQRQIKPLHDVIRAMGIPLITVEGFEADDVIATLAKQAAAQGMKTIISSGDKDMTQLVNDDITVINTMSNTILDREGVIKKFGIPPEKIVDYLALMGDTTDNIPGVPKVGPKTAVKWLAEHDTLDEIMLKAEHFTGKVGENLRNSLKDLPLSRELVTLKLNVPLPFSITDLQKSASDDAALLELFKRLEFKTWLSELLIKQEETHPATVNYQTLLTKEEFDKWVQQLKKAKIFALNTETTSRNPQNAELIGISFALAQAAVYVPVAHDYLGAPQQLTRDYVLNAIKPLLSEQNKTIVGHNLKYDISVLANYQIVINANLADVMLESYVLDSTSSRHDLESLSLKFLGKRNTLYEDIAGKGNEQLTFNQIDLEQASFYACQNADIALQLHQKLWPKIKENSDFKLVFEDIEMPLVPVLAQMEQHGVLIDPRLLAEQSVDLAKRLKKLEDEAHRLAGLVFNLASPKQLQEVLYEKLKLPIIAKTPTGVPSTAESVLQELALNYPLPKLILEHRSLSKLKSTYTDVLPKQINPKTNRVHTSYNQAVTSTGRLSSTDPNLQNIPIRHEEGRRVRKAFIAPPGYKIISADYSQIELRIMAHLSQDQGLLDAFSNNIDIHTATAAEVFEVAIEKVTSEQRRHAKVINFGLIYGMSVFGLAKQLDVERVIAQHYMDAYFLKYPHVKFYMDVTRDLARQKGYVETLFGRRLYIPEINVSNLQRRRAAERAAINAPMQGTAADIIKIAMISLHTQLQESNIDAKMIMQVHDELVFEVAEKDVAKALTLIRESMIKPVKSLMRLDVQINVGDNWDEAH
jgi:DNA polymerase-1